MTGLALSPLSEALAAVFIQDAALQALTPGGWHDTTLPANHDTFPAGIFEVYEPRDERGFGTGGMPLVEIRTHTFSKHGGLREAQAINRRVVQLLKDRSLTVEGYAQAGQVFYDETAPPIDELVNGVQCHELVSYFRTYLEEAA